jgi:ribonuclease VapC
MVIDTSALIAILTAELEAEQLAEAIEAEATRLVSAASVLETAIVIEARYGTAGGQKLDELINTVQISIEPVTAVQITVARQAYRTISLT